MAKSPSESLSVMIKSAYQIRISQAKSQQEKLALEKEKQRLLKKASQDPSSLRWYHFAQLESKGLFWDMLSLRKPLNLGSIAMDALREKITELSESIRPHGTIDRSIEPKLGEPIDTGKITETVLDALVPASAVQDDTTPTPAGVEIAARANSQKSFSFPYGSASRAQPQKMAVFQGFSSVVELIEDIADGKRSRQLAEVLHRIRPQIGDDEIASQRFAVLLLEAIGKRMVEPLTNAQFLNLQVYLVVGIKQIRPEIDPDDKYDRFAEDIGIRLKAQAQKAGAPEPVTLSDIPNIITVNSGTQSVEARNRDVLRRSGVPTDQPPAQVVSMLVEAMRLGLVSPPPAVPDRLAQIIRQMGDNSGTGSDPNP